MGTQQVVQATITDQTAPNPNQGQLRLALFNSDGSPVDLSPNDVATFQAASVAADVATLKADFNALLTKLQTAGLMASS